MPNPESLIGGPMANSVTRPVDTMSHIGGMRRAHDRTPDHVHAEWLAVGRALFGGFFLFNGIHHFMDVQMLSSFAASKGVPAPEMAIMGTGALLVLGGLSMLLGLWPRLGALMIAVFLIGVTPVMHNFWADPDAQMRMNDMANFLKNAALLGAVCIVAALPTPWP